MGRCGGSLPVASARGLSATGSSTGLHRLCALGYPVLAGLSRKSMIYRVLGVTPAQSLAGTVALGWECLRQGAAILRVHDVREAVDTVRIFNAYVQNSGEICQMKK